MTLSTKLLAANVVFLLSTVVLSDTESGGTTLLLGNALSGKHTEQGAVVLPPCTPLRPVDGASGRGKSVVLRNDRWGDVRIKRKVIDTAPRFETFSSCVTAAEVYDGRHTINQISDFEQGILETGMPAEFAVIALGPQRAAAAQESEVQEYRWSKGIEPLSTTVERVDIADLLESDKVVVQLTRNDDRIATIAYETSSIVGSSLKSEEFTTAMNLFRAGDSQTAFRSLLALAEEEFVPAQYAVADMYTRGDGVEQDHAEAVAWLQRSAARNYAPAMYHLAYLHATGEGVPTDLIESYRLMSIAKTLGNENAAAGLAMVESRMTEEQLAQAVASGTNLTEPALIRDSHVKPGFPELARAARIQGRVVLAAVIGVEGSIGDVTVLRCTRPGLGFEESALMAIKQWRWEPAQIDGEPVEVFFTVVVDFTLSGP